MFRKMASVVKVKLYKNLPNQTDPKVPTTSGSFLLFWGLRLDLSTYIDLSLFGKVMVVDTNDFNNFLKQAGKKLGIDAKYAYTASGAVLDDVALMRDDEDIFISEKAGFYRSEATAPRYKIAILGPGGVGKSCLTIRYTRNTFVETYDPTIEDAFRHQTVVDDRVVVMEILDTAGQVWLESFCL